MRYYIGSYEEVTGTDGVTTKLCYLPGGAVMMERNGVRTLYYNYTDRLGSIVSTTDAWGNVVERYAYDPWGERLNPENWTENDTRADLLNNRGFTGHEHIDGMSLINMNGRVYDPLLGSFLSVDPLIQAPGYWLNYNRYMYCYGNPLSFVDPSGNSVLLALGIGAAVGVAIGAGLGLWYGYNQGYTGWDLASCAFMGAGIGAIVGALSGYFISSSISSLIAAKTLWNFMQVGASIGSAVGLLGGTIDGLANKADGLELVNYALTGSLIGMAAGAAIGAGCYGIWSYGTSVMASESATVLKLSNKYTLASEYLTETLTLPAEFVNNGGVLTPELCRVGYQMQASARATASACEVAVNAAIAHASRLALAIRISYVACIGVGATGAGFGGYYLSKFLFEDLPLSLYGHKF